MLAEREALRLGDAEADREMLIEGLRLGEYD